MRKTEDEALQNLKEELEAERDWRTNEFGRMKMLLRRVEERESSDYVTTYLKMTVPMLYAHWEGFCVASFKLISDYINAMELKATDVSYNILTYANDESYGKLKGKQSFLQKVDFTKMFSNILGGKLIIKTKINTKSNLNEKALKEVFEEYQLDFRNISAYVSELNAFVNVRNAIAHGENSIVIDKQKMFDYMDMIVALIDAVLIEQMKYVEEKRYLKVEV